MTVGDQSFLVTVFISLFVTLVYLGILAIRVQDRKRQVVWLVAGVVGLFVAPLVLTYLTGNLLNLLGFFTLGCMLVASFIAKLYIQFSRRF